MNSSDNNKVIKKNNASIGNSDYSINSSSGGGSSISMKSSNGISGNSDKKSKIKHNRNNGKKIAVYYSKPFDSNDDDDDDDDDSSYKPGIDKYNEKDEAKRRENERKKNMLKYFFPDILKAIGNKAIRENTPTLQELEQYLQKYIQDLQNKHGLFGQKSIHQQQQEQEQEQEQEQDPMKDKLNKQRQNNEGYSIKHNKIKDTRNHHMSLEEKISSYSQMQNQNNYRANLNFDAQESQGNLSIVAELIKKGYLSDSSKWLRKKGFFKAGQQILAEIIKNLEKDKLGMHETPLTGSGNVIQETSTKYEIGKEISNININSTIQNFIERKYHDKTNRKRNSINNVNSSGSSSSSNHYALQQNSIEFPLDISYEDIEIYETIEEIRVSTVYCIDLSSTMKYSSMYNELSRIEASKRALWSLFILNKKFFPLDSIYVIGFGSIASKIDITDIPFLKTFEPNADFLHYTNYQAAYRLAKKILKKDGSKNKRIVMITDGHPSACFIDNSNEKDRILKQRPYSHFYIPDNKRLNPRYLQKNNIKLEIHENQIVYLCYRYRQIDQYIGEQTIKEAKKIKKDGIDIDTIMVSEEDTLLDFVNELAKSVHGKSIYINPNDIDKILITDYFSNKKKIIKK